MSDAQYGVQIQNKYGIFDDEDEDPLEAAQRQLEEASKIHEKKKKEEKKLGGTKKPVKPVSTKQKTPPADAKESIQPPTKKDREGDKENKPAEMNHLTERGRGRGRGEFRGPREFRGRGRGRGDFEGGERGAFRGSRGNMRGGRGGAGDMPPRFRNNEGFEANGMGNENNNGMMNNLSERFGEPQPPRGRGRGRGFRGDRGDGFRGRGEGRGGGYRGGRGSYDGFASNWNDNGQSEPADGDMQLDGAPTFGGNFGDSADERAPGQRFHRGRGRGGRPPRGDFQGRGYRGTRSHRYERHSGSEVTGVKPIDKREGRGSHNWGDTEDAVIAAEGEPLNTTNETDNENNALKEEVVENGDAQEAPVEPESQQLTYDEWMQSQGKREKPQFNIRKAGEGEDSKGAKNYVPLAREKVANEEAVSDDDDHEFHQRKAAKQFLPVDVKFSDEAKRGSFSGSSRGSRGDRVYGGRAGMGGRGRGGRGSDRGYGGGEFRGGRGGRRPREEFNLANQEDAFPELGAA